MKDAFGVEISKGLSSYAKKMIRSPHLSNDPWLQRKIDSHIMGRAVSTTPRGEVKGVLIDAGKQASKERKALIMPVGKIEGSGSGLAASLRRQQRLAYMKAKGNISKGFPIEDFSMQGRRVKHLVTGKMARIHSWEPESKKWNIIDHTDSKRSAYPNEIQHLKPAKKAKAPKPAKIIKPKKPEQGELF